MHWQQCKRSNETKHLHHFKGRGIKDMLTESNGKEVIKPQTEIGTYQGRVRQSSYRSGGHKSSLKLEA